MRQHYRNIGFLAALTGILLLLAISFVGRAHAAVIFSDDFNRPDSDIVGNGWIDPGPDVTVGSGELGMTNLNSIDHELTSADPFYDLNFSFDYVGNVAVFFSTDNSLFTELASFTGSGQAYVFTTLGSGFNDVWVRLTHHTAGSVNVDNFEAEVPEPGSLLIMGIGLLGLGALGPLSNRRRKAGQA